MPEKNIIYLTNTWAQFSGPGMYLARSLLRYRPKGFQFVAAFKRKRWDGYNHLMNPRGRFATGLVGWLIPELKKQGVHVTIEDRRPRPLEMYEDIVHAPSKVELRPYQQQAVEAALTHQRGIIHHPTGSGKTVVMGEIVKRIGRRALVLVHRKDLLYQTAERFEEQMPGRIGIIGDGSWDPGLITVATMQTLYSRLKSSLSIAPWLNDEIGQVHVDEVHHLPAKSYERVMSELNHANWRLGYSATPHKEGDQETFFRVTSWLGPTIHQVKSEQLVKDMKLVPAEVFMIDTPPTPVEYHDYADAVETGIIRNEARNNMIVRLGRYLHESNSGPVVILVERLEHGKHLAKYLGCEFVEGSSPTGKRRAAWEGLRSRRTNMLVASRIADEGLDIPPLAYLIIAGGGKAPHITIQRVGRGMRTAGNKEVLSVFDFNDQGKYLEKHATQRMKTYSGQKAYQVWEVEFNEICPSC